MNELEGWIWDVIFQFQGMESNGNLKPLPAMEAEEYAVFNTVGVNRGVWKAFPWQCSKCRRTVLLFSKDGDDGELECERLFKSELGNDRIERFTRFLGTELQDAIKEADRFQCQKLGILIGGYVRARALREKVGCDDVCCYWKKSGNPHVKQEEKMWRDEDGNLWYGGDDE